MIKLNLSVPVNSNESLEKIVQKKIGAKEVKECIILKKSIDARKRNAILHVYQLAITTENDNKYLKHYERYTHQPQYIQDLITPRKLDIKPVVVGAGPAGLFASLTLAKLGLKPIVIERGQSVDIRTKDVQNFFKTGMLNTESNVQFGEGGAGTFSDGKLNTNLHNEYIEVVLNEFVKAGAPSEILYDSKPHVGTDKLIDVVKNIRKQIEELGGKFLFGTKLEDIRISNGKVTSAITNNGSIECNMLYLGIGHSARDTFEMLYSKNVNMVPKIFSMGTRIEHLRENIDKAQYGDFAQYLPSSSYKLSTQTSTGRSLYTFCMCPGGKVINSSSEEGGICVNGMSYHARNDVNSNSAILVNVGPSDFGENPLDGVEYQRKFERAFFKYSGTYKPVVQKLSDFISNKTTNSFGEVSPSVESGYSMGNIRELLPSVITDTILDGIHYFGNKIRGFDSGDAVLTGIESRSSSPVKILRDDKYNSNIMGLIPIGEGAGYSGGIVSSAIDGIKAVLSLCED